MLAVLEDWGVGLTHCPPLGQGELAECCHEQGLSPSQAVPLSSAGTPTLSATFPGSPLHFYCCFTSGRAE